MGDFEHDTRVESLGEGRYRAELNPDWMIWSPNGGYVASIALRAAGAEARIEEGVAEIDEPPLWKGNGPREGSLAGDLCEQQGE